MVIDSHVHFWKYNKQELPWIDRTMKVLQKDYLPSELQLTLKRNNIDGCVAVQAADVQPGRFDLDRFVVFTRFDQHPVGWVRGVDRALDRGIDMRAGFRLADDPHGGRRGRAGRDCKETQYERPRQCQPNPRANGARRPYRSAHTH